MTDDPQAPAKPKRSPEQIQPEIDALARELGILSAVMGINQYRHDAGKHKLQELLQELAATQANPPPIRAPTPGIMVPREP